MRTRFAPSPTGLIHYGNARTALFNYLLAKQQQGSFLLRVEDTDNSRSKPEFVASLYQDLDWLGINWDGDVVFQSKRANIYAKYYDELIDKQLAYPCFCSEEKLKLLRKTQLASGKPPKYPGICRNLTKQQIAEKLKAGEKPTLRFKIPENEIVTFVDLVKGTQKFSTEHIGDFIIRRQDNSASFMFSNAIDDALNEVTHALRGDDHLTNTPRQLLILQALNLPEPNYGHFAMINGADGLPLSKRNGSATISDLKAMGYLPIAIVNYLARLGHSYESPDFMQIEDLIDKFDVKYLGKSPAKHDINHFKHWQKAAIQALPNSDFLTMLELHNVPDDKVQQFIELIKPNVLHVSEANEWAHRLFTDEVTISADNLKVMQQAGEYFYKAAIDCITSNYQEFLHQLKQKVNISGKKLFMPLRLALTGQTHGPELPGIFSILGESRAKQRFESAIKLVR